MTIFTLVYKVGANLIAVLAFREISSIFPNCVIETKMTEKVITIEDGLDLVLILAKLLSYLLR